MPHASEGPNGNEVPPRASEAARATGDGRAQASGDGTARATGDGTARATVSADSRPRRVTIDREGPLLVEGPVEVVADDGTVSVSDRFVVAVCTCRRSRTYPWCDTSHRGHRRPARTEARGTHGKEAAHDGDR